MNYPSFLLHAVSSSFVLHLQNISFTRSFYHYVLLHADYITRGFCYSRFQRSRPTKFKMPYKCAWFSSAMFFRMQVACMLPWSGRPCMLWRCLITWVGNLGNWFRSPKAIYLFREVFSDSRTAASSSETQVVSITFFTALAVVGVTVKTVDNAEIRGLCCP